MKKFSKSFLSSFLLSVLGIAFANEAKADVKLTLGQPLQSGSVVIGINMKQPIVVPIVIPINGIVTPEQKATAVRDAIANTPNFGKFVPVINGNMLIFPKKVGHVGITNNTMEINMITTTNEQTPKQGKIDGRLADQLQPTLSGIDNNGNESIFVASLGFETPSENISISSEFLFSELGGDGIDNWLSTIFTDFQEQLPEKYQSHLLLDLINDEIIFNFPNSTLPNSGFIENGATDTNADTSLELTITTTPEPTSALSLLALGTLGAGSALFRKRQSKSEEN